MAVSARKVRQVVQAQGDALNKLPDVLRTLEQREYVLRARVDALGQAYSRLIERQNAERARSFLDRLRWLFRGN